MNRQLRERRDRAAARHDEALARFPTRGGDVFKAELKAVVEELASVAAAADNPSSDPVEVAKTYRWLGDAHFDLALAKDRDLLTRGAQAYQRADELLAGAEAPLEKAQLDFNFGNTLRALSGGFDVGLLEAAQTRYEDAMRIFRSHNLPDLAATVEQQLRAIDFQLRLARRYADIYRQMEQPLRECMGTIVEPPAQGDLGRALNEELDALRQQVAEFEQKDQVVQRKSRISRHMLTGEELPPESKPKRDMTFLDLGEEPAPRKSGARPAPVAEEPPPALEIESTSLAPADELRTPAGLDIKPTSLAEPAEAAPPLELEPTSLAAEAPPVQGDREIDEQQRAPMPLPSTSAPAPSRSGTTKSGRPVVPSPSTVNGQGVDSLEFTVYHPQQLPQRVWRDLLVYIHTPGSAFEVEEDSRRRLERQPPSWRGVGQVIQSIRRGTEIRVIPELPGCRFNPREQRIQWVEELHCAPFRVQSHPEEPGFVLQQAVTGRVALYVETLLVGEVSIRALLTEVPELQAGDLRAVPAQPYHSIFASYSHEDSAVVEQLGKAYKALGMAFLRDLENLRSGETWSPALLGLIERAQVFQLYWSEAARASPYVEQEWRHALRLNRSQFVRPVFWRRPMPEPAPELAALHFSFLSPKAGLRSRIRRILFE